MIGWLALLGPPPPEAAPAEASYQIVLAQEEIGADGMRVSAPEQTVPFRLRLEGASWTVRIGPTRVNGRTVGRARTRPMPPGQPPAAPFCVPMPAERPRRGQSWSGELPTYPPLPASLKAVFRVESVAPRAIGLRVEASAGPTKGSGSLTVRPSGVPLSGALSFLTEFRKPSPDGKGGSSQTKVLHRVRIRPIEE